MSFPNIRAARAYRWPQERLEKLAWEWNRAESIDDVARAMGDMYSSVSAQAQRLRSLGVPMKRFRPKPIDYDRITRIAEKALKQR